MLRALTLSHFRSHHLTRLSLDGRPVAIFGTNGAGKTNVLEAASLLSPGRGLRRAAAEDLMRRPATLGWKITADYGGHEVETWAEPGASRALRIDDKSAPQAALGRIGAILWLTPAMDRLWSEAAEGRRRFFDRVALSFVPDHAEAALAYEKAMRERNRLLRDGATDMRWYDALEARMADAGARIAENRAHALSRIARAQQDAATSFPSADLSLTWPDGEPAPEDAPTLAEALARGRRRDLAAGRTLTGPHRADFSAIWSGRGLAASQCSTGEQKALLISLILANARALHEDRGAAPLLLLDEVAAHLDAGRRASLYDEIVSLGAQALLTGTGDELFQTLRGRAQFLQVSETANGSVVEEVL